MEEKGRLAELQAETGGPQVGREGGWHQSSRQK